MKKHQQAAPFSLLVSGRSLPDQASRAEPAVAELFCCIILALESAGRELLGHGVELALDRIADGVARLISSIRPRAEGSMKV